jgi:polyferredoxin
MIGVKSDKRARLAFKGIRLAFLVLFLAASTVLGILHLFSPGAKPVGVDALDPFGGIESAFTLIATGSMLGKIAWSSFILLFATIVTALVFRRVFCGKVCAFGALQELFGRLGRAIFRKRFAIPRVLDRPARYLKYILLVGIVAWSAIVGALAIRPYDPWAAYHHLVSAELISGFLIGLIVLIVSLVGSLFYDRFFCKYLCPMGGFLGLINRVGWFRVRRIDTTCTHCMACNKACPVNIEVESLEQVQSSECINCNLCVVACPVKDTLVIAGPRATKGKISPLAVLGITLGIFVAVLGGTTAAGLVNWTVTPLGAAAATTQSEFNSGDIKGSDTFAQVSTLSGIPKEEFLARFKISADEFEKPIKDASHRADSGFDIQSVRDFVKEKSGK